MSHIVVTEKTKKEDNLLYIQNSLGEIVSQISARVNLTRAGARSVLEINLDDAYDELVRGEVAEKIAEIIAINYKYDYFNDTVKICGLSELEYEILLTSLIAADLEEDRRYCFEKACSDKEIAVDGLYNFRLNALRKKWEDVVGYIPVSFVNSQLKDFISYLLENKKRRVYVDGGKVYDSHFRRLKRTNLLRDKKGAKILKEVLLSNCGEVELSGSLPKEDEFYLKEFYADKIIF